MSDMDRRTFLTSVAAGVVASGVSSGGETAALAQTAETASGLATPAFRPLPVGSPGTELEFAL